MMLGPFGALLGMILCCHKTRKGSFWIRVIFCLCLHTYLFTQFVTKRHEMMTNPGALGIDGVETPITENKNGNNNYDSYTNMDSLESDIIPDHPEL